MKVIDVRTGAVTTLYESPSDAAYAARFVDGGVEIGLGNESRRVRLDGAPLPPPTAGAAPCKQVDGAVEVVGERYARGWCAGLSPDGRWAVFAAITGEVTLSSGYQVPRYDEWVADVTTRTTRKLQADLLHCGGCDGRYGPRWSASSRYVAFAEIGGDGRRFLSDIQTGMTRPIGNGGEITDAPSWAPNADVVVYRISRASSAARLEDLASGVSLDLRAPWPVQFDQSGSFLYSPAWMNSPKDAAGSTRILDLQGSEIATLPGAPAATLAFSGERAVGRGPGGYVAALQGAPGCDGTAIYRQGSSAPHCVAGGVEARIAPGGSLVAVARPTGATGPVSGAGIQASTLAVFAIDLVNAGDGSSRTVAGGAVSFQAPQMAWSADGAYLLLRWPHSGYGA